MSLKPAPVLLAALLAAGCFADLGPGEPQQQTAGPDTSTTGPVEATTGPAAVCGDGLVQPGEQCDAGPLNGDWAICKTDCTVAACGDGLRGPTEACDGGDDCLDDCTLVRCGDGLVNQASEQCDDGNRDDSDACASTCLPVGCGDGLLQDGEVCDHGPHNADTAACTSTCTLAACGDGFVGPGEACEPSDADPACGLTCALVSCLANDEPERGEQCQVADDGCTERCLFDVCGDNFDVLAEQCDDGNLVGGDGCTSDCQLELCGDGVLVAAEACDDGNLDAGDGCSATCERDASFVFVTEGTFSGALGNADAADAACQAEADAAALPGTYRAWLTFPGDPPAASFERYPLPYLLPGSLAPVASSWLTLVDGDLDHPIDRTAAGLELPGDLACSDPANLAWTHTRATGSPFPGNPCSGWLLDNGTAVAGLVHATGLGWTEGCPDIACAQQLHLYCIQQ
ncbi:DUF4215 domain-containing protein [Nannocystis bainbridge]|uniref:DUF4215 domain-containing protein n=1 Tax=Nannocystis bainbridge TaxID=2995303 RepID=A0ABT5E8H0_9BACT|nr:DUF4215 domain-containing protein [Nannocystis bainbridge]MDC0722170.1 DUF4215 domain-containing protein [Nannocystis bainbridge]